jgi:hypothetical protein
VSTKRGIKRASADVGLMFTALNLRRLMNIIEKNTLKKFLRELAAICFSKITLLKQFLAAIALLIFSSTFYLHQKKAAI